jgi:hypothetical protein
MLLTFGQKVSLGLVILFGRTNADGRLRYPFFGGYVEVLCLMAKAPQLPVSRAFAC